MLTLMFPSSPRCFCYVDTNVGVISSPLARGVVVMLTLMFVKYLPL